MRVVFTQPARAARNHIIASRADNLEAAAELSKRLTAAAQRLGRFPNLGRPGRQAGTRELVLGSIPYMFVYRVDPEAVVILDIRHTARKRR